jgi:hypothetical protein
MVRIRRFGVITTSNVAAAIYFVLTLIIVIPIALLIAAAPQAQFSSGLGTQPSLGPAAGIFLLIVPFVYALVGWLFTAIFCLLYNLAARFTGGIAVEVVHEAPPPAAPALEGWGHPQT